MLGVHYILFNMLTSPTPNPRDFKYRTDNSDGYGVIIILNSGSIEL